MSPQDAEKISRWRDGDARKSIAINTTFQMLPVADVIYACDKRWWDKWHDQVCALCAGERWAYDQSACDEYGLNKSRMHQTGGNGGYQAARLAITEFEADRLILVGYDMKGKHWHGDHPQGFPNPTEKNFPQWINWLGHLRREFPDVEFLNATRDTAIPHETIPRVTLEDALSDSVATV